MPATAARTMTAISSLVFLSMPGDASHEVRCDALMPNSRAPLTGAVITARLRTAGCVFAEDEARLLIEAAETPSALATMVERRVGGLPLEYVIGWAEFCGLRIGVDRGVFVPRHRSELLVAAATARTGPTAVVVDMCCGSGAVGAAIAHARAGGGPACRRHRRRAVACARGNLAGVGARVHQGDLYEALPGTLRGHVDVLVANVPYVPTADIELLPREAREHEPRVTLDGGEDGLDVARRLVRDAGDWLSAGGHVLVETSDRQAGTALRLMSASGLTARREVDDDLEATVIIGHPRRVDPGEGSDARARSAPRQRVDGDSHDEHEPGDDELPLHGEAEQEHPVVDATDDQAAEDAVDHPSSAAERLVPPMTAAATAYRVS